MRASIAARTRVAPVVRHAPCAMVARVETPIIGSSAPSASPCAMPIPIRTPVKLPGPRPKASASRSVKEVFPWVKMAFTRGRMRWVCSRGHSSKWAETAPSFNRATEQASVAVSIARIRISRRALARVSHKMARILAHSGVNYSAVGFARKRTARFMSRVRGAGGRLARKVAP